MYTIWDIYHRSQQICQIGEGGHKSIECRGEIKPDIIIYESLGHIDIYSCQQMKPPVGWLYLGRKLIKWLSCWIFQHLQFEELRNQQKKVRGYKRQVKSLKKILCQMLAGQVRWMMGIGYWV